MADNVNLTAGDGTIVAGADVIGGVAYPRVKVNFGTDGSTSDVSTSNPLPVDATGSVVTVTDGAGSLTVDGTVTANLGTIGGASTAAKQPALGTAGTASADVITIQGIASGTVVPVSDGSGSLTVDNGGTFAVQSAQSGTWTVQPGNTANTTAWKVDASSVAVPVTDNSGSLTVDNGGTFAVQGTAKGTTAADAAVSDAPVTTGGRATNTNLAKMSADGDVVNTTHSMQGAAVVSHGPRELLGVQQTSISNSTSETTIVTAAASGIFNDLYGLIFANTGATTTKVTVKDATSGTTRIVIEVPTLETRGFMLSAASAVPQASAANNWTATCAAATTAMEVTAFYIAHK